MTKKVFILMGVSCTGKTTIGTELAKRLNIKLIDGDDLHPKANIIKMATGQPLNDQDRLPWLERIRDVVFSLEQKSEEGIVICSALKKQYRDFIRSGNKNITFLFLQSRFETLLARASQRQGHYMQATMLKSQFDILEVPTDTEKDVITVDVTGNLEQIIEQCVLLLQNKEQ